MKKRNCTISSLDDHPCHEHINQIQTCDSFSNINGISLKHKLSDSWTDSPVQTYVLTDHGGVRS